MLLSTLYLSVYSELNFVFSSIMCIFGISCFYMLAARCFVSYSTTDVNHNVYSIFGQALPLYAWFHSKFQNFIEQLATLDSNIELWSSSADLGCDISWPKLNLKAGDAFGIIVVSQPLPYFFTHTSQLPIPMRSTWKLYNLLKIIKDDRRQASLPYPMLE